MIQTMRIINIIEYMAMSPYRHRVATQARAHGWPYRFYRYRRRAVIAIVGGRRYAGISFDRILPCRIVYGFDFTAERVYSSTR